MILDGPIVPMLARLAAPNIVMVLAQTSVTIAEAWYIGRLGTVALASVALVFPLQALMQMMSAGAMGGGISSAVARAIGGGRHAQANALAVHAVVIALGMSFLYVLIGAVLARPLFQMLGAEERVLDGAVAYAQIAFGGASAMWLANTFASILRGSGNMLIPGLVLVCMSALQIALGAALTFGIGPIPEMGVRGPATALVLGFSLAAVVLGVCLIFALSGVRLTLRGLALRACLFMDILKVGAIACGLALLTISTVLIVTRLVATLGPAALAGFGLGSRLELMLVPIAFGLGGAMTASVGINFGASQYARARRIAWTGGLVAAAVTGLIGVAAAIEPALWLSHFTTDAQSFAVGSIYLRIVGPLYGFFGIGMALYFATQGTGNMIGPCIAGLLRIAIAAGGGALAVTVLDFGAHALFACVAAGLFTFGTVIVLSLFSTVWQVERRLAAPDRSE